jgi:hypothetical protein
MVFSRCYFPWWPSHDRLSSAIHLLLRLLRNTTLSFLFHGLSRQIRERRCSMNPFSHSSGKLGQMKRYSRGLVDTTMKMMMSLSQRHIAVAAVVFTSMIVWIWVGHLAPAVTDEMPVENLPPRPVVEFEPEIPVQQPAHHAPPGTLPRFYSLTDELKNEIGNITRPMEPRKIMGLVFFGRRQTVSILDCYLKVPLKPFL